LKKFLNLLRELVPVAEAVGRTLSVNTKAVIEETVGA
jgi:hypothetical protein